MNSPITYARPALTGKIHYCSSEISGPREVESNGLIVQVRVGPWSERNTLKKTAPFFAYALDVRPKVYFGSATDDRSICNRIDEERTQIERVYIIYSRVPCFDPAMANRVEGCLVEFTLETGVPVLDAKTTHHAPHPRSMHSRYGSDLLSAAHVSDLTAVIETGQPSLWVHGHVHESFDYRVGATRVVGNPHGYGAGIENPKSDRGLVVEVGS
jgi:hypothetical protein